MNDISKELQLKLNKIQKDIKLEKKLFLGRCRDAQESLNFDLYDKRVIQKLSDVIQEINETNSTYYAYLKVKLEEVDQIVSAYDKNELDYEVVEQVYQLIQYINEESKIESCFTGSLNSGLSSVDLGTMAVLSYSPSIAAKEMEIKWKENLKNMPVSKKREYDAEKSKERNEKNKYYEKLAVWEKECEPINQLRENYVKKKIETKTKKIQEELLSKYSKEKNVREEQIQSLKDTIYVKTEELDRLGLFKRKEKKAIHASIIEYQRQIEDLTNSLAQLKVEYQESHLLSSKQAKESVEKDARLDAEKIFRYPLEPEKPESIIKEEREEQARVIHLSLDIFSFLVHKDRPIPMTELYNYFVGQEKRSDITKALNHGVEHKLISQCQIGKKTYYSYIVP